MQLSVHKCWITNLIIPSQQGQWACCLGRRNIYYSSYKEHPFRELAHVIKYLWTYASLGDATPEDQVYSFSGSLFALGSMCLGCSLQTSMLKTVFLYEWSHSSNARVNDNLIEQVLYFHSFLISAFINLGAGIMEVSNTNFFGITFMPNIINIIHVLKSDEITGKRVVFRLSSLCPLFILDKFYCCFFNF